MKKENFSKKIKGGEKMNNWKLAILPLVLLFVVGIAQAAITSNLTLPAAGATVAGTYKLGCTGAGVPNATTNLTAATFYYGTTTIGTNTTGELNATQWDYTWDSTAVSDHIADFKCTVTDSDANTYDDTSLAVIIDNTIPACTWVLPTGNEDEIIPGDLVKVTLTGTGGEDSTCTALTFGGNSFTPTLASGGGSCSWSSDGEPPEGIYTVSFTASDGTNSTTCSVTDVSVQEEDNVPAKSKYIYDLETAAAEAAAKASQNKFQNIALLILGIYLVWLVFFNKKK